MPTRSVEALAKILELEQANGYGDLAVIGGLDAYLRRHFRIAADKGSSSLIAQIYPPDFRYTDLTRNERKDWAEKVRQHLDEVLTGKEPGDEGYGGGRGEVVIKEADGGVSGAAGAQAVGKQSAGEVPGGERSEAAGRRFGAEVSSVMRAKGMVGQRGGGVSGAGGVQTAGKQSAGEGSGAGMAKAMVKGPDDQLSSAGMTEATERRLGGEATVKNSAARVLSNVSAKGTGRRFGGGVSSAGRVEMAGKRPGGEIHSSVRAKARGKKPAAGVSGDAKAEGMGKKAGGEVSGSGKREATLRRSPARVPRSVTGEAVGKQTPGISRGLKREEVDKHRPGGEVSTDVGAEAIGKQAGGGISSAVGAEVMVRKAGDGVSGAVRAKATGNKVGGAQAMARKSGGGGLSQAGGGAVEGGGLDSPISVISGVGPAVAKRFNRLGVKTIKDLLYFFPRRHLDYGNMRKVSDLDVGPDQTLIASVWEARQVTLGRRPGTEAILGDGTGTVRAVWFNQPYLAKTLRTNTQVVLSGRVGIFKGKKVFESPEWEILGEEDLAHTGRLVPVYPLTEGLYPRSVRKLVKRVVLQWGPHIVDFLPQAVMDNCSLMGLPEAIMQTHYPDSEQTKEEARRRLAFDELFVIQVGVFARKQEWQESRAVAFRTDSDLLDNLKGSLPFTFTHSQQRVLEEILSDVEKSTPMCRLLQGEVGSGKTVVATTALLAAAANGYQGALMVPTEVLAEQHFKSISRLMSRIGPPESEEGILLSYPSLPPYPFTMALLTGSLSQGEKRRLHELIRQGEIHLVIGTHALIQKGVEFKKLGLAVVDEQHRFGVLQRSALRQKGTTPHVLVMSATPIPRTLAFTIYGDLDLSVIDELPPGRVEIETRWLEARHREGAYGFIRRKIAEGRQAFVVCPLVEESEAIEATAAVAEYERLSQDVFPDLRLGLLHGRMSAAEKEAVMRSFRDGELDILVSTPVVEVGIDVPNAVVMLIEGAERFGLSQLHQFRGRVGRGEHKSYCLLLSGNASAEGRERLRIIEQTRDGFLLAEEDLKMRGPGEFFGTQQSGLPDLRMARLSDVGLLESAREETIRLLELDRHLEQPEHRLLAHEVARLWERGKESG